MRRGIISIAAQILIGAVVIAIAIFAIREYVSNEPGLKATPPTTTEVTSRDTTEGVSERQIVTATLDILGALSYYHLASVTQSDDFDELSVMRDALDQNNHLKSGNGLIRKYVDSENEVIQLSSAGMLLGSQAVEAANDSLVKYLREADLYSPGEAQELQYQLAQYLSDTKEGYTLILISAPQITALMFELAESENPIGKIPYTISDAARKIILDEVDRLFSDNLEEERIIAPITGKYNAILTAVGGIRNNVLPNTYEEARLLEND